LPKKAHGDIQVKVIEMKDKRTIQEWEQEFELNIVDMDGFDKRDPKLFDRLFTKTEFEQAIAFCTVIHKQPRGKVQPAPLSDLYRIQPEINDKERYRKNKKNMQIKRVWFLYASFPIPAATALLLKQLYRLTGYKLRIPWYYPLGLFTLGFCILLFNPVTTLVAGPFYVWYLILGFIAEILGTLYFQLVTATFHKGALPLAHNPFLGSVNLFGNPMNLYFSPGKAVTSSIIIAILIVSAADLVNRLASTKSAR
jgi:hypothetical protein